MSKGSNLETAGSVSKNATAIVGLLSGLVGVVIGVFGAAFYVRDELQIWNQIKSVHAERRVTEGVVIHNHKALSDGDISAIRQALDLPNFSLFALAEDIPASADLSVFVRSNDLPDFTEFAKIEDMPSLNGYAKLSDIPAKPDLSVYIQAGDRITLQGQSKYLFDQDSKGRDELDVTMSVTPTGWTIGKEK